MKILKILLCITTLATAGTMLCMTNDQTAFLKALKARDAKKIKNLFDGGFKPNDIAINVMLATNDLDIVKTLIDAQIPIPEEAFTSVIFDGNFDVVKFVLSSGIVITEKSLQEALNSRDEDIINLITIHLPKETLKKVRQEIKQFKHINPKLRSFIHWLANGAPLLGLLRDQEKINRFAAIAFTIPSCHEEFITLLNLINKNDYSKVFTESYIQKAFLTLNIKALEALIAKGNHFKDAKTLTLIANELDDYLDNEKYISPQGLEFANKLQRLLKPKKFSMPALTDVELNMEKID